MPDLAEVEFSNDPTYLYRTVLSGQRFGRWTVLEGAASSYLARVACRCDCGTERLVLAASLPAGQSRSCGCTKRALQIAPYITAGDVFGRWTALEDTARAETRSSSGRRISSKALCRCACGTEKRVSAHNLRRGESQSCGCLNRDAAGARATKHGLHGHPLYHIWLGMHRRCSNPHDDSYADYGGRGIAACERWQGLPDGLLNFAADMGPRPSLKHSVERRDNGGPYAPWNCVWATQKEQRANQRQRVTRVQFEALRAENQQLKHKVAELEALLAAGMTWRRDGA